MEIDSAIERHNTSLSRGSDQTAGNLGGGDANGGRGGHVVALGAKSARPGTGQRKENKRFRVM